MKQMPSLISFYETHDKAGRAIVKLQKSGFDMKRLSIAGADHHTTETVTGCYTLSGRMKKWGSFGAFWGGFWGLLPGSAFFIIPGIGALLVAGPLVSAIVGALEGEALAANTGVLCTALVHLGISKRQVVKYEAEIKAGKFMLLAHGTATALEKARKTLGLQLPKENKPISMPLPADQVVLSGGEHSLDQ